jgi:hypothetical protein
VELIGIVNSKDKWPISSQDKALASAAQKEKMKKMHKVIMDIQHLAGISKIYNNIDIELEDSGHKMQSLVTRMNKARITKLVPGSFDKTTLISQKSGP